MHAPWGSMAELTVTPRSMCFPVPEVLDDVQAAAIANPGMSAWGSMKQRGKLVAGETVLVMGATGVAGNCPPDGEASGSETGNRGGAECEGTRRG